MENHVMRGSISHVLAQARASLKNPSRPFTPSEKGRPLFMGTDYRPESRPSSTFTSQDRNLISREARDFEAQSKGYSKRRKSTVRKECTSTQPIEHFPLRPQTPDCRSYSEIDVDLDTESNHDDENEIRDSEAVEENDCMDGLLNTVNKLIEKMEKGQQNLSDCIVLMNTTDEIISALKLSKCTTLSGDRIKNYSELLQRIYSLMETCATKDFAIHLGYSAIKLCEGSLSWNSEAIFLLSAICKYIFVISKDSENDEIFCNIRILECFLELLRLPIEQSSTIVQVLIYSSGTLKNVSNLEKMQKMLSTNGAIGRIGVAFRNLRKYEQCREYEEKKQNHSPKRKSEKEAAQLLIQLTAILRNLSIHRSNSKQFVEAQIIREICFFIQNYNEHVELMLNSSRILSKLSLHEVGRNQLNADPDNLGFLVNVIQQYYQVGRERKGKRNMEDGLILRICFVLGNLTSSNDKNRERLVNNTSTSMLSTFLNVLVEYYKRYKHHYHHENTSKNGHAQLDEVQDVLIKLVRLFANLSINARVGKLIIHEPDMENLVDILSIAINNSHEELMLNTVSCITNLSFYCQANSIIDKENIISMNLIPIADALLPVFFQDNEEALVESSRCLGNLSHFPAIVNYMQEKRLMELVVVLLDHCNREVVYTVCGVLMNLVLKQNPHTQKLLHELQTPLKLLTILRSAGLQDLDMSTMACKVLFNFLLPTASDIKSTGTPSMEDWWRKDTKFGQKFASTLEELVDTVQDQNNDDQLTKEFISVAQKIQRTCSYSQPPQQTHLVPLD